MLTHTLRTILLILLSIGSILVLRAQNLVPNPSFEVFTSCPTTYGITGNTLAPPWIVPTQGTPDYFNACAVDFIPDVPTNYVGYQPALTGDAYFGLICYSGGTNFREYLTAPLLNPLSANQWYDISFYLNVANIACGINSFGAYFSILPPSDNSTQPLNVNPQFEANQGIIDDTTGWIQVSGCFQANGGESYITLGNFNTDAQTLVDQNCGFDTGYFLIEDVSVIAGDEPHEIVFDLGGPEEACFQYEIDPGLNGYHYLWEDGSNNPTLVVTESGVYYVTISDGCDFGIDSIEVTILSDHAPLEFGTDEITLCNGESVEINLDPDLGTYVWQDGSTATDYTISTSGSYSVTLNDGCEESSDGFEVVASITPQPFNLGADDFLCTGEEIVYAFDAGLGDFLWQDGNTSSTYIINQAGVYSLTISNICGSASDEIIFTPLDTPEVELGPDVQVLCTGEIVDIELDPSLGDFLWQDGSQSSSYIISQPGVYSLVITNECGSATDQIDVQYADTPVFDFGPDVQICPGQTLALNAGNIIGNYFWQDSSVAASFIVNSEGTYALTLTTGCGVGMDSIVISYADSIVAPYLGPDTSLCEGDQVTLAVSCPGASFIWQDTIAEDSFLVDTAGIYFVTAFNFCFSFSDTIVFTQQNGPPQLNLPAQLSLCAGQTFTLEPGINDVSYHWNDGSDSSALVLTTPGTYSLTISNNCGQDADTTIILDGGPVPFVDLGPDLSFCNEDTILVAPVFSNVDSWLWPDASTDSTYEITSPGAIYVQVTNSCGATTDTLQINLLPPVPSLNLGADTTLCTGDQFELEINIANVNISWSDQSASTLFIVTAPGTYFADIHNACGSSSDTIIVSGLPQPPPLNLGNDQSLCEGDTIVFSPGISGVNYLWQDGSSGNSLSVSAADTIVLTISNSCGSETDSLILFEDVNSLQINLGPDITGCAGDTVTIEAGITGVVYEWQDGSNLDHFITSASGSIILNVSNHCGSEADTLQVDLSMLPPATDLGSDTSLCVGSTLLLQSIAPTGTSVVWQDGSTGDSYEVTNEGYYTIEETNLCGINHDTIVVEYISPPDAFTLGADTVLCESETLTLFAPITSDFIEWQDGSTELFYEVDHDEICSLTVSNECGEVPDTISVTYNHDHPQIHFEPAFICPGQMITLDAGQTFDAQYLWNTGEETSGVSVTSPGIYAVTVQSACFESNESVTIAPDVDCKPLTIFYIPNIFSPNDDDINDEFTIRFNTNAQVLSLTADVFDRWGNIVFTSTEIPFTWDGRFEGQPLNPGVFIYKINITYFDGSATQTEQLTGDVSLIR